MRELSKSEVSSVSGGLMGFTLVYSASAGGSYYDNGMGCAPESAFAEKGLGASPAFSVPAALAPIAIAAVVLTGERIASTARTVYTQAVNGKFGSRFTRD